MNEDLTETKSIGIQVQDLGQTLSNEITSEMSKDKIIPWDDPSLQLPLCSWTSYPLEPSPHLKKLIDIFSPLPSSP